MGVPVRACACVWARALVRAVHFYDRPAKNTQSMCVEEMVEL